MMATNCTAVRDALAGVADYVRVRRDGTVVARAGYFYRHGRTAEKFARNCEAALRAAGLEFTVAESNDRWAPWPRDSYFEVELKEVSR